MIISIDVFFDGIFLIFIENSICCFDGVNWMCDIFLEELNMDFEGGIIFYIDEYIWVNNVLCSWKWWVFQLGINLVNNELLFFVICYWLGSNLLEIMVEFFVEMVFLQGNCLVLWLGKDYFV